MRASGHDTVIEFTPQAWRNMVLVQDYLEHSADRLPDKVALVCDDLCLTYAQVEAQANRLAHALLAQGLQRGERVATYLPNSAELVAAIFAVLKAGGVFVIVNHTTKRDRLVHILNNCRASALIAVGRQAELVDQVVQEVPSCRTVIFTSPRPSEPLVPAELNFQAIESSFPSERPPRRNIDVDLACLIYTSGSTGEPKGVMSDHSNVDFVSDSVIEYLRNREDDILLNVLPLSFGYGLYQLLMAFKFGGTLVLEKGFTYPAVTLKRLEKERVTGFAGVPSVFAVLLQMDLTAYDLSALRYVTNAAAALPVAHIAQIRSKLPWVELYSMYGLTETKRATYLPPDQLDARPGSVGLAIPGTEVWLEDDHGHRLGPGQVGELVVRGRHVMRGYWDDPTTTAERFRPGPIPGERVCYTGDLFTMDAEGYLYFLSRKDDVIKSRGEKVFPKEVETVLYNLPGVVEAAVIGVPDPILGQALKAFVVRGDEAITETDVLRHCRANLEDIMVPKYLEFRSALPKTASGKIKKSDLT